MVSEMENRTGSPPQLVSCPDWWSQVNEIGWLLCSNAADR